MKQVMSKRLPHTMENVCLSTDEDCQMYAVGSKAHTDLLDSRTLQPVRKISSRNSGCGIRSVSFKGNILTIGTGIGLMLFWDLRACKFLESTMNSNRYTYIRVKEASVPNSRIELMPKLSALQKMLQKEKLNFLKFFMD